MSIPPPPEGPYQHYGPPYRTWGQGYSPYTRPSPVNGVAIAALVLGLLCFVPAAGLVLGVIALAQIRRKGQSGKGMAIAGVVLSSVGLALWVVTLATGAASGIWRDVKDGASGNSSFSLVAGQCFDVPGGSLEGLTYDVDEVPCEGGHDGEVFGSVTMSGGSAFPGDDAVSETADEKCTPLEGAYVRDSWVLDEVDVYYFGPTRESWRWGDRAIACVFGSTDDGKPLSGSLRADESSFDADQLAFLEAMDAVDAVLWEEPEENAEDDLAASQGWARDVRDVLGEQAGVLRGHTWPADAARPVAALLKDMDAAREVWAKAAAASDADTFYTYYDDGWAYIDGSTTVTARKALGLDTTPPSAKEYDDEDDSSGGGNLNV
ncbi:DUF4190 domain-containing protein [Streptomyces sp. YU58]|uniref:DUF4190 domain-containing protein n=1 Tax=Streptomyces sp. SX92 TaxID=3158972 RepID=UPI0027BA9227|nr:DUF4190 domain-containing protein [Streptomyces coralus]WLW52445.1 DUF4190 domain-containing protein [Streptomyces coralus]